MDSAKNSQVDHLICLLECILPEVKKQRKINSLSYSEAFGYQTSEMTLTLDNGTRLCVTFNTPLRENSL